MKRRVIKGMGQERFFTSFRMTGDVLFRVTEKSSFRMTGFDRGFLTVVKFVMLLLVANFIIAPALLSQEVIESEVVNPEEISPDSLAADTARPTSDLDTIVTYAADTVRSTVNPRVTLLSGNAMVQYRAMLLTADKIEVWWDLHLIKADGRLDTVRTRRTRQKRDSLSAVSPLDSTALSEQSPDSSSLDDEYKLEWRGLPEMYDGTQTIVGHQILYDLRSRRGRVLQGKTDLGDGDYTGQRIKRVDKDVYYIESGNYTTCDYDDPHYTFWSKEAKLVVKDKVVARPVVLKFGPVPVMIAPFAVFPTKGGRHSGLIIPTYGESAGQGRYFRNLGYFWAANDYFDLTTKLNFYERSGIQMYSSARYKRRYVLDGNASGSWVNQAGRKQWDIAAYHNQTLSPTSRLVMDARYATATYYDDYSLNLYERLNKTMRSNLTLTKNWEDSPYSGSVNMGYEENLVTGQVTQKFPIVRFSRSQSAIIPPDEDADPEDIMWWNKLFFSYGGELQNRQNINSRSVTEVDSVTGVSAIDYDLTLQQQRGIKHTLNFSARPDPMRYGSIVPSLAYAESWYDEWYEFNQMEDSTIDTVERDGFRARRTFTGSVGLNTKLYGIFKPGLFSIEAIRHTLTPGLSFGYTPDFGEPKWDYYKIFPDSTGKKVYYDEFSRNTLYGGTPRREIMSMSISLGNLVEYKQMKDDKIKKGELFTMTNSTGINFLADSLKWDNLTSTMRIKPFGGEFGGVSGLAVSLTSHHSFYKLVSDENGRKITISDPAENGLRLLDFNLRSGFNISGEAGISADSDGEKDTTNFDRQVKDRFDNPEWTPSPLPWKAGVNFRYYESHADPDNIRITNTAGLNLDVTITDNWKASYNTTYDLRGKRVTSSSITLYRDMHCWEGRLNWNPTGVAKGFYLIINIKASQLQDVKVEKRKGGGGGIYSF